MINIIRVRKGKYVSFVLLAFLMVLAVSLKASDHKNDHEKSTYSKKEYNAGESIIEHILDSYYWHILEWKETVVSLPLPVILFDEGKFHIFMSSKFHHGHKAYKGFEIAHNGSNKGKIVKIDTQEIPLDLSITKNVLSLFISLIILIGMFLSIAKTYKIRNGKAPKGLQSLLEPLIIFIRDDIAKAAIGQKKYMKFLPYLLSIFFFIFINNLMGIIPFFPGGANVTGNIGITMVLALFTFIITSINGNKAYWKHIINAPGVPWWLKIPIPLMPIVELIGVFTKPFVLMVRLFANITAGHIIILGFISLIFIFGNMNATMGYGVSIVSIAFAVFMGILELLVAFIQAYVFTLLSAIYFGMATEDHH
jgi:F-type H+-transporting ATPase subunit a